MSRGAKGRIRRAHHHEASDCTHSRRRSSQRRRGRRYVWRAFCGRQLFIVSASATARSVRVAPQRGDRDRRRIPTLCCPRSLNLAAAVGYKSVAGCDFDLSASFAFGGLTLKTAAQHATSWQPCYQLLAGSGERPRHLRGCRKRRTQLPRQLQHCVRRRTGGGMPSLTSARSLNSLRIITF